MSHLYDDEALELIPIKEKGKVKTNCVVLQQGGIVSLMCFRSIVLDFIPQLPDVCLYKGWNQDAESISNVIFFINKYTSLHIENLGDLKRKMRDGTIDSFDGERKLGYG